MSNARIEATNNKIKLIIRKAYGATPGYSRLTPIGAATAQYAYSFKGWL
ncbi:MAG: transposase [Oscillospiraceae bacterium]|nr:transposase [Oscillospiraceae bacterium]